MQKILIEKTTTPTREQYNIWIDKTPLTHIYMTDKTPLTHIYMTDKTPLTHIYMTANLVQTLQ
jgi:hypothetical protein